jgi:serine/threonine protein kinase
MSATPPIPNQLGPYQIISLLGAGGMGEVYLGTDPRLHRRVAIKVLPSTLSADEEAQQRMTREARLIATIDHPNVCTIYEIGEDAGRPFIVMQYIEGETLGDRMRRGRLSLPETLEIARQITAALGEAHKRGIVHRDIKPGNIMISSSGTVKVLDFGLAKSFLRAPDDATEVVISARDVVAGTTPYMSPEQLLGEPLDGRTDIFSLGVVLYEIATGSRPFDRRTAAATINAILMNDPEPLAGNDLLPLEPLIRRALEKPVGRRFPDASAMQEALLGIEGARLTPSKRAAPKAARRAASPPTVRNRRVKKPATDPAAEKLYLRARTQWNKRSPEAVKQAIALFQEVVEIDPLHANSFAGLADAYLMLGFLQVSSPRSIIPKAKAAALRSITLDPSRAEPHATLGYIAGLFEWDWETAKRELTEAMRLDPQYPWAPHWYGLLAASVEQDDALRCITLAHELDPLSPILHTAIGIVHHWRRDYAAALQVYRQLLDSESTFAPAHYYIGLTYEQLKDYDHALVNFNRSADLGNRGGLFLGALGHCLAVSGDEERARTVLDEMQHRASERYVSPYNTMIVQLGLGDIDGALVSLEQALEDRAGSLWHVPVDPRFDRIRDHAQFVESLKRHGLRARREP